ncbi:hypothetical protein KEM55_003615 [Ascosphaera atra]|nr:hypothetical protein KEM55_003615 [Ascosphaera atra]
MELCLYNAVLTGMSIDGKAFTYDNPLGSSEESISERQEWFEISCCPPNVTRLFGYLGGCLWTQKQTDPGKLDVNVHLYTSATLHGEVNGKPFELRQESNWPWDGDVKFELQGADDVEKTVRLRIPAWAESFEVSPAPESYALTKGYLALSPEYLRTHRSFQFQVGIKPRLLRPHPYTNQPIVAVARGPIVYCVEDVDNTWVKDHFKSVVFDTTSPLLETVAEDLTYDVNNEKKTEPYIAIVAERAARFLNIEGIHGYGQSASIALEKDHRETLRFVPYFARANRGGRGMMRVGLRVGDYQEA